MTRQNPRIFDSTNNFSARQQQGGGTNRRQRDGICAALSSLWCFHMLDGVRDLLSKPSNPRAQALQVGYRWDPAGGGADDVNLLFRIGLNASKVFDSKKIVKALKVMEATAGTYYFGYPAHRLAAQIGPGGYYFYDCDENGAGGLFLYDNVNDWKNKIQDSGYSATALGSDDSWTGFKVTKR
jgi:hypothetical protein